MPLDALRRLADQYVLDPAFRAALRLDATVALRAAGYDLAPAELAAVRATDWSISDEQLHRRLIVATPC
jgi:hypothetical protein